MGRTVQRHPVAAPDRAAGTQLPEPRHRTPAWQSRVRGFAASLRDDAPPMPRAERIAVAVVIVALVGVAFVWVVFVGVP